MLTLHETAEYRKGFKRMLWRGKNRALIDTVVNTLLAEKPLDPRHLDHPLKGKYARYRECHVENDWILVYTVDKGNLILTAAYTGTHSDIFG